MTLVGVDPGKSGGVVVLTGDNLSASPMPETDEETLALFRSIGISHDTVFFIENPPTWAGAARFAKQTVNGHATATLQGNYKLCVGLALGLGARVHKMVPIQWMNAVGCRNVDRLEKSAWKKKLRAHAESLYPEVKIPMWMADAILVLEGGRKLFLK